MGEDSDLKDEGVSQKNEQVFNFCRRITFYSIYSELRNSVFIAERFFYMYKL